MKAPKTHYAHFGCHPGATTNDPDQVTCGICLRTLNRKRKNAAPPIGCRDGIPIFQVKAEGRFRYPVADADGRRREGCYLVFTCPKCGQRNLHGGIYGDPGAADGHRAAHCPCWRTRGYYIVEASTKN